MLLQAMLKYDAGSREVRLTVDRDYKAGKLLLSFVHSFVRSFVRSFFRSFVTFRVVVSIMTI